MADLVCVDLGRGSYDEALQVQRQLVAQVRGVDRERAYVILVEHDPPVITLGRRADERNVLAGADELAELSIEVRRTERGGDVTYHGPGQLVAYPILRLDLHGRDVHRYLRDLEEVIIRTLARFDLVGRRINGLTGVWVGRRKVAAIGVAVKRWVSYHGLALNVSTDLSHFRAIVPCGIADKEVTTMSDLLARAVSTSDVKPMVVENMVEVFDFERSVKGERP